VAGNYIYICADAGLVIVDISKIGTELAVAATQLNPDGSKVVSMKELERVAAPANPDDLKVVGVIPMSSPKCVRVQFRYAFVVDCEGLKVVDITEPTAAKLVPTVVPFKDARSLYLSRTYALVAAGCDGLGIVDITTAEKPVLESMYTADGHLNDVCDIKVGMTNASVFGYVANGKHGLAVLQLTSPETTPTYLGWSSKYNPQLIATKHLHGRTVQVSEGLQRDRGVDESGNQLSVFNRVGSRPFNKVELERMYKIDGKLFTVSNDPMYYDKTRIDPKGGGVDPALAKQIKEMEEELQGEKNPAKKKKLQLELDELKKKAAEQAAGGGPDPAKVKRAKELEEEIKDEKNPAKRKKLQTELDELKKELAAAPDPNKGKRIKELEEEIKDERNPAKKKKLQAELEELKK